MITSKEHFWRSDFIHCAISTLTVVVPCLTKSNFSTTALDMSTIRFREVGPQRSAPKLECTAAITWFVDTLVSWPKRGSPASKYQASPLECGGRGGIRTPGLLIANEGKRCCNHLHHTRVPLNGVLGVPMETLEYRLLPAIEF